jgi:hypothetical protein
LEVSLADEGSTPEGYRRLAMTLTASDDLSPVSIQCELPEGAKLHAGNARWTGALAKGARKEHLLVTHLPPGKGPVTVRIRGVDPNGNIWTIEKTFSNVPSAKPAKPPRYEQLPDGSRYKVYD